MEQGVPTERIYGYHEGWDFERLTDLFRYFKRRDLERQRDAVMAVAIGASSISGGKPLKRFTEEIDKAVGSLRPKRRAEMQNELSKLIGIIGGGI